MVDTFIFLCGREQEVPIAHCVSNVATHSQLLSQKSAERATMSHHCGLFLIQITSIYSSFLCPTLPRSNQPTQFQICEYNLLDRYENLSLVERIEQA